MAEALEARRRERDRLLGLAREYVDRLSSRIPVVAAAAVGSVARGDFNVWSDVDVVVVAEGLPERYPDRSAVLLAEAQARIQPVGFTADEFEVAWEKGNALVKEAAERSVPLLGDGFLRRPRM